jgi:hypothetical protein
VGPRGSAGSFRRELLDPQVNPRSSIVLLARFADSARCAVDGWFNSGNWDYRFESGNRNMTEPFSFL